jgi:hypothetical protein
MTREKWTGVIAQAVQHLPSKHEALSLKPRYCRKEREMKSAPWMLIYFIWETALHSEKKASLKNYVTHVKIQWNMHLSFLHNSDYSPDKSYSIDIARSNMWILQFISIFTSSRKALVHSPTSRGQEKTSSKFVPTMGFISLINAFQLIVGEKSVILIFLSLSTYFSHVNWLCIYLFPLGFLSLLIFIE